MKNIGPSPATFDLDDTEIQILARRTAEEVRRNTDRNPDRTHNEDGLRRMLRGVAQRHQVAPPAKASVDQQLNRMLDASWWRRAFRKRFRRVEYAAILAGHVQKHASPYASTRALRRAEGDKRRNAELMASLDAVNQVTGEIKSLEELVAQSLANPENRFKAMAARIRGIETYADEKGMQGLFLTITCPSRMHSHFERSGRPNPRYEGTSPRAAHAYLHRLWSKAMRNLKHAGVQHFGMRVVEPHHDGCPHWHVLVFIKPEHETTLTTTLRGYALVDSPDEPGAQERRFEVVRIDKAKGGALGYVIKYVSKGIDGTGMGEDNETNLPGEETASRAVTWARVWGIRQFQFFGLPPITPCRELYRAERESLPSEAVKEVFDDAKRNDYAAVLRNSERHGLRFRVAYTEKPSLRYADELNKRVVGFLPQAKDLPEGLRCITRTEEWRIQPRGAAASNVTDCTPWTRFNNSASPLESTAYELPESTEDRRRRRAPNDLGRRRGRPAKHCPSNPATPPQTMEIAAC
jgi:hypothetical protein